MKSARPVLVPFLILFLVSVFTSPAAVSAAGGPAGNQNSQPSDQPQPDAPPPGDPGPSWIGFAVQPEGGFLLARVILPMEAQGQKSDNVRGPQLILLLEKEDYFMVEGKLQMAEDTGEAATPPGDAGAADGRNGNRRGPDGPQPPQLVSVDGKLSATPYWRPETMLDMQNDPEGTKAADQFKGQPQIVGSIELKSEIRMEHIHVLSGTIDVDGQTYQLYAAPPPPPPGHGGPGNRKPGRNDPQTSGDHSPQGQR